MRVDVVLRVFRVRRDIVEVGLGIGIVLVVYVFIVIFFGSFWWVVIINFFVFLSFNLLCFCNWLLGLILINLFRVGLLNNIFLEF